MSTIPSNSADRSYCTPANAATFFIGAVSIAAVVTGVALTVIQNQGFSIAAFKNLSLNSMILMGAGGGGILLIALGSVVRCMCCKPKPQPKSVTRRSAAPVSNGDAQTNKNVWTLAEYKGMFKANPSQRDAENAWFFIQDLNERWQGCEEKSAWTREDLASALNLDKEVINKFFPYDNINITFSHEKVGKKIDEVISALEDVAKKPEPKLTPKPSNIEKLDMFWASKDVFYYYNQERFVKDLENILGQLQTIEEEEPGDCKEWAYRMGIKQAFLDELLRDYTNYRGTLNHQQMIDALRNIIDKLRSKWRLPLSLVTNSSTTGSTSSLSGFTPSTSQAAIPKWQGQKLGAMDLWSLQSASYATKQTTLQPRVANWNQIKTNFPYKTSWSHADLSEVLGIDVNWIGTCATKAGYDDKSDYTTAEIDDVLVKLQF